MIRFFKIALFFILLTKVGATDAHHTKVGFKNTDSLEWPNDISHYQNFETRIIDANCLPPFDDDNELEKTCFFITSRVILKKPFLSEHIILLTGSAHSLTTILFESDSSPPKIS